MRAGKDGVTGRIPSPAAPAGAVDARLFRLFGHCPWGRDFRTVALDNRSEWDAKLAGDPSPTPSLRAQAHRQVVPEHTTWLAERHPARFSCRDAGDHPLADLFALKFGERGHDAQQEDGTSDCSRLCRGIRRRLPSPL
ncbi:MAG: hypothetical protein AAB403_18690 [Planctomycetota bacterium]